jgi:hypothetical protein
MKGNERFKELSSQCARKILDVGSYWAVERVEALTGDHPDFAYAKQGCEELEEIMSRAAIGLPSTDPVTTRAAAGLSKIKAAAKKMEAERTPDDDDDKIDPDQDESQVSIAQLFRDL